MTYSNIYRLLDKFRRDSALQVEEADFIEWAGEALQAIGTAQALEECVAYIEVENHECSIPTGLNYVLQIAINNCEPVTASSITETTTTTETSGQPVPLDCNGTPITDYELAYYRPYFDLIYEYQGWTANPYFQQCFTPVRLADNTFFKTVVCQEQNPSIQQLYQSSIYEYSLMDPYIRFSFKEGQIALAFLRTKVDDNGYPMIPDHYSVNEAITRYVRYKLFQKQYDMSSEPHIERKFMKAESDWQWYCGQAGNHLMMPKTIDDMEDLTQARTYLLPRQYSYYNFFGRRNQIERKTWDRFETRRHTIR